MNWTITTEVIGKGDRDATVKVTATKGEHTLERTFTGIVSPEGLRAAVRNWLENWERLQTLDDGTIDVADPTPETPKRPTREELDREEWVKDWQQLQKVQRLSQHGVEILTSTQKTALVTKVRNGFKVEYQDLV